VTALLDARGCLTDAGFAALDAAPPGLGPAELAAHLAGCGRCQRRYLARGGEKGAGIRAVPGTATRPPLWRTVAVALAALLLLLSAVAAMRMLAG
jgi:hypothetical protein